MSLASLSNTLRNFFGRLFVDLDALYTAAPVDADRHVNINGDPPNDAMLVAVIVGRIMMCYVIVPDRNIALLPAPAHRVFGRSDMTLQ